MMAAAPHHYQRLFRLAGLPLCVVGLTLSTTANLAFGQGGSGTIDEIHPLLPWGGAGLPDLPDPHEWRNFVQPPRQQGLPPATPPPIPQIESYQLIGADLLSDQQPIHPLLSQRPSAAPTLAARTSAVPEPTSLMLLALGALLAVRRR